MLRLFAALLFCVCYFPLGAVETADLVVEIIVFRQPKNQNLTEIWPEFVSELNFTRAIKPSILTEESETEQPIRIIANESLSLQAEAKKLLKNKSYRVLLHTAWSQPNNGNKSLPILIQGGEQFSVEGQDVWELEGTLSLKQVNHLHHSKLDLILRVPPDPDLNLPERVAISQVARAKFKDLYYFDHPLLGVLLKVTPANIPLS